MVGRYIMLCDSRIPVRVCYEFSFLMIADPLAINFSFFCTANLLTTTKLSANKLRTTQRAVECAMLDVMCFQDHITNDQIRQNLEVQKEFTQDESWSEAQKL